MYTKMKFPSMHRNRKQLYLGTDSHKVRTRRQARNNFSVVQQVSFTWRLYLTNHINGIKKIKDFPLRDLRVSTSNAVSLFESRHYASV